MITKSQQTLHLTFLEHKSHFLRQNLEENVRDTEMTF